MSVLNETQKQEVLEQYEQHCKDGEWELAEQMAMVFARLLHETYHRPYPHEGKPKRKNK